MRSEVLSNKGSDAGPAKLDDFDRDKKDNVMDELAELSPIDEDDEEFKTTAYANNAFAFDEEKL